MNDLKTFIRLLYLLVAVFVLIKQSESTCYFVSSANSDLSFSRSFNGQEWTEYFSAGQKKLKHIHTILPGSQSAVIQYRGSPPIILDRTTAYGAGPGGADIPGSWQDGGNRMRWLAKDNSVRYKRYSKDTTIWIEEIYFNPQNQPKWGIAFAFPGFTKPSKTTQLQGSYVPKDTGKAAVLMDGGYGVLVLSDDEPEPGLRTSLQDVPDGYWFDFRQISSYEPIQQCAVDKLPTSTQTTETPSAIARKSGDLRLWKRADKKKGSEKKNKDDEGHCSASYECSYREDTSITPAREVLVTGQEAPHRIVPMPTDLPEGMYWAQHAIARLQPSHIARARDSNSPLRLTEFPVGNERQGIRIDYERTITVDNQRYMQFLAQVQGRRHTTVSQVHVPENFDSLGPIRDVRRAMVTSLARRLILTLQTRSIPLGKGRWTHG